MATDAIKTSLGDRNLLVQSHKSVIWLEVEHANGHDLTTISLTTGEARQIAGFLTSQAVMIDTVNEMALQGLLS
jgi:hypothetical protein